MIGGTIHPVLAQTQRYPTPQELESLITPLQSRIATVQNSRPYRNQRTTAEKQRLATLVKAWSTLDPAVAPFLGEWRAIEETKSIYPSRTRGRVCIVQHELPASIRDNGLSLSFGTIANGQIQTEAFSILVRQGDFLGAAFVQNNHPYLYEYGNRGPLKASVDQQIRDRFNQAGCLTGLPK
ncbi:hypothetical protein BST81_24705 [Leptolyngbya sp. 'hensonii']|nr:hypothetical protein BST81_24705 [Leptolyngbya sp. 'hensonii']